MYVHVHVHVLLVVDHLFIQVRMYCESQPRNRGRSWMELFPDDAFPNDTPEDKVKSKDISY